MDECFSLIQAVAGGNSSTVGFVLMPHVHSSAALTTILKNRRLLEDKCTSLLGCVRDVSPARRSEDV